jgi:hypothetical protein
MKKNINPIIEKPIRIKDGITDPMHCQVCEEKKNIMSVNLFQH